MDKSGKIEYEEDKLKWAAFVTWVTNKIQHNIAKLTKFFQYFFFKHTLQTLLRMLRDISRRRWQASPINSAE